MAKVITFSRNFPVGHSNAGQPTHFVEKIYKGLYLMKSVPKEIQDTFNYSIMNDTSILPKIHTIRAGKRWKVGDKFSPRVWTGKPYASKQLEISPELTLQTVIDFEIELDKDYICILIGDAVMYEENSTFCTQLEALTTLAKNDGLSLQDFKDWFKWGKQPFKGQLLSWMPLDMYYVQPTTYVK